MRRRRFVAAAGALAAAPLFVHGQPAGRRRAGVLMPSTPALTANLIAAFEQGLREHGYEQGRNLALDYRYSGGDNERLRDLAAELVRAQVDVIVTTTDPVARIVKAQTGTIPIVMVNSSDPVGEGLVHTLAQPRGNVTGLTNFSPEISAKRVQLLKEAVPALTRLAYLWNPDLAGARDVQRQIEAAARALGLQVVAVEAKRPQDIEPALAALPQGGAALLVQAPNPVLYTSRKRIADLAKAKGLPSMFNRVEYLAAGGFMSYGPNVPEMYRRAAAYVDKILRGSRPDELPVEQPSSFELAINLRTARVLGIVVSQPLLLRADKVLD